MSTRRALSALALLAVVAVVATGCAPERTRGPVAAPTSASPTPTETADSSEQPPLMDLVLTTEGLGELTFDAPPPSDDPSTNLVSYDATACATETPDDPGLWLANYPDIDEGNGPIAPFAISAPNSKVTRIDVNTTQVLTDQGLGLGSSLDAVLGSYPGGPDAVINHSDVSDVYVFNGVAGKLMFEVAVDRIPGYWDADKIDTVVFLSAVDQATEPYGVAASDNTIGVCRTA